MKRHKHLSPKKNYLWIAGIVLVVIILSIILFSGKEAPREEELATDQTQEEQIVVQDTPVQEEVTLDAIKEASTEVTSKTIGEEGLCEDYFFEQGDELKILTHTILIERIGATALRLQVDGEHYVMAEGDSEYAGDGIRLSIADGKILYFGADDPSNAAMVRVGCDYDVNPNEKYVENRGKSLCVSLYESCQNSFGIDLG